MEEQLVFTKRLLYKNHNPSITDSLWLNIAINYYQLNATAQCTEALKHISGEYPFTEKRKQLIFSLLLLGADWKEIAKKQQEGIAITDSIFRNDFLLARSMLKRELVKNQPETMISVSPEIIIFKTRYFDNRRSSPFLAGLYSTIMPGLGKLYLQYPRQATTAFIANILLAGQAIESFIRAGVSSPRFLITAPVFGIFYIGNIWGSVVLAKKKRKDRLNQLDYEIIHHYRSVIDEGIR